MPIYKSTCNFIAMSQSHRESVSRMQRCTVDLCSVIASNLARQHALYSRCVIHVWQVAPCTLQGMACNTELSCKLTCHETVVLDVRAICKPMQLNMQCMLNGGRPCLMSACLSCTAKVPHMD